MKEAKKIKVKCRKCEKIYETNSISIINSYCRFCNNNYKRTTKEFKKEMNNVWGNEFEIIGNYNGRYSKILVKHNKDGCEYKYETTPKSLLKGHGCPKCSRNAKLTKEEFENRVDKLYKGSFKVVGNYKNMKTNIEIKHNCGNTIKATPDNILRYLISCDRCLGSKGEHIVKHILDKIDLNKLGMKYVSQYYFRDCKRILPLRFDFCIINKNKEPILLIEYDGEGHFIDIWGTLESIQESDRIKEKYCEVNKIPLIRLKYDLKENLEEYLLNELNKYIDIK